MKSVLRLLTIAALAGPGLATGADPSMPIIDAHIHYSHDAWEALDAPAAIAALRAAGLARAFVSSSGDEGTRRLYDAAPDLVVPVLRPYRRRGESGTWLRDDTVIAHLEARLAAHRYAGIGEFHVFGADADLPVMRRVVELAREHGLFLHVHGDAAAVSRIFAQDPRARVLWAHSGFVAPPAIAEMLVRHDTLWADLAFRADHVIDGQAELVWRALFEAYPERFMLGTDTYTPERWHYVQDHADWSRAWLSKLPATLARRIARENAEALIGLDWRR